MKLIFLKKLRKKLPRKYAALIAANAVGISTLRVYGVRDGRITDPVLIKGVEDAAKLVFEMYYPKKPKKTAKIANNV